MLTYPSSVTLLVYLGLSIWSCFPTEEIRQRQQEKLERHITLASLKDLKSPVYPQYSNFEGEMNDLPAVTPRTQAFTRLDGTPNDLPLRNHYSSPSPPPPSSSPPTQPGISGNHAPTYFPPPPNDGRNS